VRRILINSSVVEEEKLHGNTSDIAPSKEA